MCGIAGGHRLSKEIVEKMTAHQGTRGPDNTGFHQLGDVIFGHNRLAIVDKSELSNQPVVGFASMLTYNGEIYNLSPDYPSDTLQLKEDLRAIDDDEELWLMALNNLNGMFAFAHFDGVNLVLARDRFGIKPLYYKKAGDQFAFASTPAAVNIALPGRMSERGLQEYLSLGATMNHSMFEGILAVPPGHYVIYNTISGDHKLKRWYTPQFRSNAKEIIQEEVLSAIDRVKLTCDWPQIVLLSGGIDSTMVASRFAGQKAIHLLSPEVEYAVKAADRFNLDLIHCSPAVESAEECLTDYISKSGDPTMAGLIPYITCKEIKKQGFRVAITANGADELFYGYDRMRWSALEQTNHIFRRFDFFEGILASIQCVFPKTQQFAYPQLLELYSYLAFDLNKTLDFASMCHSVEVRVPFLDHNLVEAALSLSAETHVGRLGNKTILKTLLHELGFSPEFINRPKVGFSLHVNPPDWFDLNDRAMKWYVKEGFPSPITPTPRQESYHQSAVTGLYLWSKLFG